MHNSLIWIIAAASIALMLFRPFRFPEVVWTSAGALLLCLLHLIPWKLAGYAVIEGADVYFFLAGMMLLSELAKVHGVFDWLADGAVKLAAGSPKRLFTLLYGVGTLVTIFMSNDATAVVLTPAVAAALKRAKTEPMPFLLACAMIANAASFVLPISNPANLVVFHTAMPPLRMWLAMFAIPSVISILITFLTLRWLSRRDLIKPCNGSGAKAQLSTAGKATLAGIAVVAIMLLISSALKHDLGLTTCVSALVIVILVEITVKANPIRLAREISWSVLPLVAALFVIVEAVKTAGAMRGLQTIIDRTAAWTPLSRSLAAAGSVGVGTNLVNNLPLGLLAGASLQSGPFNAALAKAVLIGIDLGPNLSITGSLATILWLIAIRREGMHVSGWQFFKAGLVVMPLTLLATIAVALLFDPRS
jgi:arsenical pump membrane protein